MLVHLFSANFFVSGESLPVAVICFREFYKVTETFGDLEINVYKPILTE